MCLAAAGVSVNWLKAEDGSDISRGMAARGEHLHAPRLMASGIANALWRKARLGEIERGVAGIMLASVPEMPVRWGDDEMVCGDAIRLALALDRPVYDCVYLALAHRIGAIVVTADLRFVNALASTEHGEAIITLNDYGAIQG